MLDRVESGGFIDWKYKIVETSANLLVLEMNLAAGQYCCSGDAFQANEVITIREVYKRME